MDTNRWGRRREREDTPIRSSAPKVLSRLREAACQRQTLMRFLRGWMLINFMTKHVNIKGLQIHFSAVKKMPFYWPRGTGLPPWSGHQTMAVVLTVWSVITTVQPANPVPRCMCWPSPKDSGQLWYLLTLTSKTPLEGKHRPGGNCRATLVSQVYHRQLPDPCLFIPAAVLQASSNSSREDTVLCHVILGVKFSRYITPLAPTPSLKSDAYKLDSLQRL